MQIDFLHLFLLCKQIVDIDIPITVLHHNSFSIQRANMDLKIILLISCAFFLCFGRKNCPNNCDCEEYISTCAIVFCEDKLDVNTVILKIEGRLCTQHYEILKEYPQSLQEVTQQLLFIVMTWNFVSK